jgi:hypothetical protein
MIRAWARTHRKATGRWPDANAGPVRGVTDEMWAAVDAALRHGHRGLPGGSSLTTLFDRSLDPAARGIRPGLTVEQVLAWADAHRAATGRWPTARSGPVDGVPGEKWFNLDSALRGGRRGLPGGTSLIRLIAEHQSKLAELRKEIAIGVEQADRGEVKPFNEETTARVKARGRSRLNAQNGSEQA